MLLRESVWKVRKVVWAHIEFEMVFKNNRLCPYKCLKFVPQKWLAFKNLTISYKEATFLLTLNVSSFLAATLNPKFIVPTSKSSSILQSQARIAKNLLSQEVQCFLGWLYESCVLYRPLSQTSPC